MPQEKPTPLLECYADQFILDLKSLPEDKIVLVAKDLPDYDKFPPLECIKNYIKAGHNRISQLLTLVIEDMPYYSVVRHYRWIDKSLIKEKYLDEIINLLGEVRLYLAVSATEIFLVGDSFSKFKLKNFIVKDYSVKEIPCSDKIADLDTKISNDHISLDTVNRDLAKMAMDAQKRAVKAENELRTEKIKWAEDQKRRDLETQRGKQKVAETSNQENQVKLNEEIESHNITKSKLDGALKRLKEINEQGGATPERVQAIKEEIQRQ